MARREKQARDSTQCIQTLGRQTWSHVIHVSLQAKRHVCIMWMRPGNYENSALSLTVLNNVSRSRMCLIWDGSGIRRCIIFSDALSVIHSALYFPYMLCILDYLAAFAYPPETMNNSLLILRLWLTDSALHYFALPLIVAIELFMTSATLPLCSQHP